MSASVVVKIDKVGNIVKALTALTNKDVLVGIPDQTTERKPDDDDDGPVNNATLGYIHEHGSPANNIPARPFLIPGVKDAHDEVEHRLKKAANLALDGNLSAVDAQLSMAGQEARDSVKAKINSGDFEPLADATLEARARKGRKGAKAELASRRAGNAPSTALAKPLIDTGQLRNSITYVVRGKK
jgi:hypothetical protein